MLVLGEKAQSNGLGKSLLQRLHELYQQIVDSPIENPYTGEFHLHHNSIANTAH